MIITRDNQQTLAPHVGPPTNKEREVIKPLLIKRQIEAKKLGTHEMKVQFAIIIIFGASIFTGCDPGQTLIIKTSLKSSVEIYGKARMLPTELDNDTGKIILRIPSTDNNTRHDTSFNYGIGTWDEDFRDNKFVDNVDSIIINNASGKFLLKDKTEINEYIKNHRSGYSGNFFTIEAK